MSVAIPAQYQAQVAAAAKALNIPAAVVAAQIDTESSWNPQAVSPAGAQGIAQFEPGTWKTYGHGSPFNVADSFAAYTAYMGELLKEEHGDVRAALEAYNAGPGNLGAGAGYADGIIKKSGVVGPLKQGGGGLGDIISGAVDLQTSSGGLLSWPSDITQFFGTAGKDLVSMTSWFAAFGRVSTWIRIGAGALALPFLVLGVWCLIRATRSTSLETPS